MLILAFCIIRTYDYWLEINQIMQRSKLERQFITIVMENQPIFLKTNKANYFAKTFYKQSGKITNNE